MKSLTAIKIKEALDLRTVMEFYGIAFNRVGFASCCFHEERTASLSVKGSIWRCFGCGAGGDAIAFTMKFFGLSFPQALVRLDSDFHLGIIGKKPDRQTVTAMQRERHEKRLALERAQTEYMHNTRLYRLLLRAYKTRAPQRPGDQIDNRYIAACKYLPALDHWFATHEWQRG